MTYFWLVVEFIKTGLFAVGGGYATIPFLNSMADNYGWFDRALLADMVAISESTPGPIGINMATYAGFLAGAADGMPAAIAGGIIASLALIFPSIIIVTVISNFLKNFKDNRFVEAAFYGLRPAVTALIASAGIGIAVITVVNPQSQFDFTRLSNMKELILFAALFAFTRIYKKSQPLQLIGAAAVMGVVFGL